MNAYIAEHGETHDPNANISNRITATAIAFLVVEIVTTALRLVARRMQKTGFMWSDVFIPLSLFFNIGVCICGFLAVHWGGGRHADTLPSSDIPSFMVLSYYALTSIYLFAITFPRLAVLDLYLNIFIDRFSRWMSYLVGFMIVGSLIGNWVAVLDRCSSPSELWHPTPGGWCLDIKQHCTWASFPNIITDIMMLVLPLPVILKLRVSWQQKLGVVLTFLVGSFGLATSIIRFAEFWQLGWSIMYSDPTWASVDIFTWTIIEPGVYHIAACAVTYGPLVRWVVFDSSVSSTITRIYPSIRGSDSSTTSSMKKFHGGSSGDLRDLRDAGSCHADCDLVPHDIGFSQASIAAEEVCKEREYLERNIFVETDLEISRNSTVETKNEILE